MKQSDTKTRSQRRGWAVLVLAGAILIVSAGLIGCQGNDSAGSTVGTSAAGKLAAAELPSLNTLDDALNLTDAQSDKMAAALNTWSRAIDERQAARSDGRQGFMRTAGSPPAMTFLADASDFLDNGQMVKLAGLLKDRQETMRDQMRTQFKERRANHDGGPRFDGARAHFDQLAKDLNLTEEQQAALTKLRESMHEKRQAAREQGGKNGRRGFAAGQGMNFRDRMRTELESILTEEQLQRLDAIHEERSSQRRETAVEHADERLNDHVDFLARILKLSDAQKADLETTLRDTQSKRQDLFQNRTDDTDWQAMREQAQTLRTDTDAKIEAMLTADQKELYASLADLLPLGPRGPRPPR